MNPVEYEYHRLRRKEWAAQAAWRAAKTNAEWDAAEWEELVKLDVIPEFDVYDDSFIDTWGLSPKKAEAEKKEIHQRIERDGCWIIVSYFRPDRDAEWIAVDSVGGFIGDDYKDSGYDTDLKRAALDALVNEEAYVNKYN